MTSNWNLGFLGGGRWWTDPPSRRTSNSNEGRGLSVPPSSAVPPLLPQPSTSAAGAMDQPHEGSWQQVDGVEVVTRESSAPAITVRSTEWEQLLELLNQHEQVDREVEAFSGGGGSEGAYCGLEERLMRLLCAVDVVEVGRQQALRDLQRHANASITKSMRELERKAGVTPVESAALIKVKKEPTGSEEKGAADVEQPGGEELSDSEGSENSSIIVLMEVKTEVKTELDWSAENGSVDVEQPGGEESNAFESREGYEPMDEETAINGLVPLVTRGAEGELVLDEETLRCVVCRPEVHNSMLAIFSVVGPPRSGKSLLVNLMRDYLAAKRVWLEDENAGINYVSMPPSSQIEQGAVLQLDETQPRAEMLLWPEPFIVSDDLAVILVESVLTEDMQVFALSTLVSSLQVINITAESFTWPGTDMLQFLRDFSMASSLGDRALQRCVALIRDDSHELSGGSDVYGLPGGTLLFNKWLHQDDMSLTKKKLQSMMRAFYHEQVESFARPPNKNDEIQGTTTNWLPGPLAKRLVEWLLQPPEPQALSPKLRLLGHRELRAHELPTLLACLVQELQRPDLSPAGLVTVKYQEFVLNNTGEEVDLVDHVLQGFDKTLNQLCFASVSRAALDKHYTDAKTTARSKIREALKDSPQLEEDLQRADEHMQKMLSDMSERIKEVNKEEAAYEDALAVYMAEMGDVLKGAHIPSECMVRALHKSTHEMAIDSYVAAAPAGDPKKRNKFLKKLEEEITIEFDNITSQLAVQHRDERIKQADKTNKSYAIGIDLGTTFSCASVYKDGKVVPIVNKDKKHTTPSVVYFGQHGVLVGEEAKFKGFEDPANCVSEVKRIIGRTFDDTVVQSVSKQWAFKVTNRANKPQIQVSYGDKKSYAPEEVSALLLKELKHQAEVQLGSEVHDAVVTIPAYFTEPQRDATLRACKEAGLNVLRLLNEPTAAAMAYGLQTLTQEEQGNKKKVNRVLVFDFGGGTCDVSILELRGSHFVVKASRGDNQLGGEDYDNRLTKYITDKLEKKTRGLKLDAKSSRRLRYMAEIAKCRLTNNHDYQIHMPNFPKLEDELDTTVHRSTFEKITSDLSERALVPVRECLEEAGLGKDDIKLIVLAGGSSRIPKIQELLMEFFPGKPLYDKINPDEAIASGAALQAALLTGECERAMRITDITPFSLGIGAVATEDSDNLYAIMIKKNTQIPCSYTSRRFTVDDNQDVMSFPVYQGENTENEYKNTLLGYFNLENVRKAPAGKTEADVNFSIDENGILHVTAEEVRRRGSKKSNKMSITISKRVNM